MKFFVARICCLLVFTCVRADVEEEVLEGFLAEDRQFPHQVSLQDEDTREHFCGGSILTDQLILTAGHCVCEPDQTNIVVVAGTNSLEVGGQSYEVTNIVCHGKYEFNCTINDIAILKLKTQLKYSENIRNIILPLIDIEDNKNLYFSGWGYIEYFDEDSMKSTNVLQSIELINVNWKTCKWEFKDCDMNKDIICARSKMGSGPCRGDSGGALIDKDYIQYGINSVGAANCNEAHFHAFVSVYYHKYWIEKIMWIYF